MFLQTKDKPRLTFVPNVITYLHFKLISCPFISGGEGDGSAVITSKQGRRAGDYNLSLRGHFPLFLCRPKRLSLSKVGPIPAIFVATKPDVFLRRPWEHCVKRQIENLTLTNIKLQHKQ